MSDFDDLTRLFRKLGAKDPESWAKSQVDEGINQLGRFLFLREAWKRVISESDHSWMDAEIARAENNPREPTTGVGLALKTLFSNGCDRQDISDLVRGMQYELLFSLCYLLDDPGQLEEEVQDVYWGLFQVNDEGKILSQISGLHESLLETDPTGREMRPR